VGPIVGASTYLALLGIAIAAATVAARFARIPYTVGLVVAGLAIGLWSRHPAMELTPDLVMFVFLPSLLFAAAWEMDLRQLARFWIPIALLATVGVVAGIGISYALLAFGAGIDPHVALVFGVLVAATDPVAVIALFREMRVDRGLAIIVEGESLFNDGVAVVAYRALVLSATATGGAIAFSPMEAAQAFFVLTAGGALVGVMAGVAALFLRAADNAALDVAVTAVVAYGSYIVAEQLHLSGIVAVIAAGLTCSLVRSAAGSTEKAKATIDRFWEGTAFLANSVLFVLIGLSIDLTSLVQVGSAAVWGIAAVLVARAFAVYALAPLSGLAGRTLSTAWQHVIALGGLRGALSMALALSVPEYFHFRAQLIAMVYSVVLFTLVVQGLALRPAIAALAPARREQTG
jgi:CPA1 family monovalent cation:H+ antiporter